MIPNHSTLLLEITCQLVAIVKKVTDNAVPKAEEGCLQMQKQQCAVLCKLVAFMVGTQTQEIDKSLLHSHHQGKSRVLVSHGFLPWLAAGNLPMPFAVW
jgi:F0F1-type ATP synthase epsilon subunit